MEEEKNQAAITVEHVGKAYGKKKVLNEVSFWAGCGEQISLIGRNGSGKTTLLQILSGILKPESGTVCCFGQDMWKNRELFAKYCGYLPQENPLLEELSVQDNLRLWSGRPGKVDAKLADQFELQEILKTPVRKLSGGMKRRVAIACCVVNHPPILMMDEPTASLDYFFRDSIHTWMEEYRREKGILIVATHDEKEMEAGDRCYLLENGVLKQHI